MVDKEQCNQLRSELTLARTGGLPLKRIIYTAEDIGSYKPSDRNFDYMVAKLEALGIQKHEILHTAESLSHDHEPANRAGLASCWIHRRHADTGFGATMAPSVTPTYQFRFTSLMEMAKIGA